MKKAVKSCKVARGICLNYDWPPPEMRLKAPKSKEVFYHGLVLFKVLLGSPHYYVSLQHKKEGYGI